MKKPKTQTFNIVAYSDYPNRFLDTIEGELIEKYGVKIIFHKKEWASGNGFYYNFTEFYTGMLVCSTNEGRRYKSLEMFEKLFNDPDLTDLGRKEKLEKFHELIQMNVESYGYANQDAIKE